MCTLLVLLTLALGPMFVHSRTTFYLLVAVVAVVFVVSASIGALAVIRIGQERRAGLIRAPTASTTRRISADANKRRRR